MFRYLTAGESHGRSLVAIIDGLPAGLKVSSSRIDRELLRRQAGYGRSKRMQIEKDRVEMLSGLRNQLTIGSPLCLLIHNRARENWESLPPITAIRPGHADLAGALKYGHTDLRNVLERSSARETAIRVAVGAVAKILCEELAVTVTSNVTRIGPVRAKSLLELIPKKPDAGETLTADIIKEIDRSPVRCIDRKATKKMMSAIDDAKRKGDSLGGTFEVIAIGVPPGLGSYVQWDRKLDGRLAQAVMSIQAIKGIEIGLGFGYADRFGSSVHDRVTYDEGFFRHKTNNAGGIEGGVTNGEPVVLKAVMKPIPTLRKPLPSVDFITRKETEACVQRSDVCAVPAAGVIAEAVVAVEIAKAFQEKFGSDTIEEIRQALEAYRSRLR